MMPVYIPPKSNQLGIYGAKAPGIKRALMPNSCLVKDQSSKMSSCNKRDSEAEYLSYPYIRCLSAC